MLVVTEISTRDILVGSNIKKNVEDYMHCSNINSILNFKKMEKDLESCCDIQGKYQ